ncbi:hypothetical protein Tco_0828304, partial [Tanacetum coccineum]
MSSEQPVIDNDSNIEITSDSNVISYYQYLKKNENEVVQSTTSPKQHDAMIMSVIDEMYTQVAKCNVANQENKIKNESLTIELERYKELVNVLKKDKILKQGFWLPISQTVSEKPSVQPELVQNDLPCELPSIKYFKTFDQGLFKEINEMKVVFNQMEIEVDQCSVDRKYFEIEKKELLIENDRLLEQILSQDIVCIAMNSYDDNVKY